MTPDREDLTAWLLQLLRTDAESFPVGDHGPPVTEDGSAVSYPFWVVWGIPGGGVGGPALGAAAADADFVFQIDSIGLTREQSGRLAARARARVIGRGTDGSYEASKPDPSGIVILDRFLDGTPGAPAPEGDRPNEVWTTSERFVLSVTSEV